MPRMRLEKVFSYFVEDVKLDPAAAAREVADWWAGFEFVSGPVMTFWKLDGVATLEVWAISEAEGKGVIAHALAHMGLDPDLGEFRSTHVKNKRFGKTATMRVSQVSARDGSSGKPYAVILDPLCISRTSKPV